MSDNSPGDDVGAQNERDYVSAGDGESALASEPVPPYFLDEEGKVHALG
jgi:hypothetical protein